MNKNSTIKVKSPTRVDFSGGTLDLWPLYSFLGGAKTINVAIDIFTYAELEIRSDLKIQIESVDLGFKKEFLSLNEILTNPAPELRLYQSLIRYFQTELKEFGGGFNLKTRSESPVGAGLGGSSSLMISLLKAFSKLVQRKFSSTLSMVEVAHNLEAEILRTPTGTQDYFPAVTGGVSRLIYSMASIKQEFIDIDLTDISKHFILAYTGKPHHSGINNFEVLKGAVAGDAQTLEALYEIKEISERMDEALRMKNWSQLPELFALESKARVKVCSAFSSVEIERLATEAKKVGAVAHKICGAGGGGCVLLWVPQEKKQAISEHCISLGFRVLPAMPVAMTTEL